MHGMSRRRLLLITGAWALAALIAPASASNGQAGLSLRRTRFVMDDHGQVWLSAVFLNEGTSPISVRGIAPSKSGPWTQVGQTAAPGASVRGALKVKDGGPPVLWVDSSQGLLHFPLPHSG